MRLLIYIFNKEIIMANIYEDKIDPPQSRIEERLRRIEKLIEEGGGGDSPTASDEDIEHIEDTVWPDQNSSDNGDVGQGGGEDTDLDDEETASQDDIDSIKDGIWGD